MRQELGAASDDRLPVPNAGGRTLTSEERAACDLSSRIPGWGSDLDPARRPGVPRDAAPEIGGEWLYPDIEPQRADVRIHKSTEHGRLTPVFGTSCPPRGLSGLLRDVAYRYGEGRMARWTTLLLADRVDMLESLLGDVLRLQPPNLAKEMGWRSEWRHRPTRLLARGAMAGLCAASAVLALAKTRRS